MLPTLSCVKVPAVIRPWVTPSIDAYAGVGMVVLLGCLVYAGLGYPEIRRMQNLFQ
jgi:hypothetical protein